MSWRTVVITKPAKLELRLNYMVVRSIDRVEKISLTELGALVIETLQVSITGSLISALLAQEIRIIICDEHHDPQGEILPYYGCHDCSRKIQMQMGWQETTKKILWQEIVRQKIMNQRKTLEYFCPDATDAVARLAKYETQVEIGDATHREGLAAKEYFPALLGKEFTRAAETAQNAALNYGYQIIISIFSREIKIAGYLTEWGIFHDSQHNHFNLSSDLMEPWRPVVDAFVREKEWEQFAVEEKHMMQRLVTREDSF
ncbi:MAG: type II CRISPR-associated endonuclease Cas1 [Negativicoccus succinicivorans]|nr:type II CRISPR-associated endonuclease Cas1 [Negativicoccus succinicivorans]